MWEAISLGEYLFKTFFKAEESNKLHSAILPATLQELHFLPLPLAFFSFSGELSSPALNSENSSPLVNVPLFLRGVLGLRMWCSGIHSSWYPPAPVAVTAPTGALTAEAAGFLFGRDDRLGANAWYAT